MKKQSSLLPGQIAGAIILLRNRNVMLDRDLAVLYGVKAIVLRQQVKRNLNRFPDDFMFQLTSAEVEHMVSQFVIPSVQHLGGTLPYAFTQEGVAMLSSVLRSKKAVHVNIEIMRVFVKLRESLISHKKLAEKIDALSQAVGKHDQEIDSIFQAIRELIGGSIQRKKPRIGF